MRSGVWVTVGMMLLIAGCLGLAPEEAPGEDHASVDENWYENAFPYGPDHDHTDPAQHANLSTPNFNVLGWDPLITDYHGATSGDYFCGGVALDGDRQYAVVNSFFTDVAMVIIDVTDRENPELVGELVLPGTWVYDSDITSDGQWAVLGMYPPDEEDQHELGLEAAKETMTVQPTFRDACGNEHQGPTNEIPYASGTVLVDLSDPTEPTVADYDTQPVSGPHSIFANTIDGEHFVLASVPQAHVRSAAPEASQPTSYYTLYTIEDVPIAGGMLLNAGSWSAQYSQTPDDPATQTPLSTGHLDGWVEEHPITGQVIVYLANWDGGIIMLEYTDPGLMLLGEWNDYDETKGTGMSGQWHGIIPMDETWNDRHYSVIHQELGQSPEERPTGMVAILDTTDPEDPYPVARWTLPVETPEGAWGDHLQFSTHYVSIVDEMLFVSLYHGGIWAVNASQDHWPELPSQGVFIPDNESPQPVPEALDNYQRWTPIMLDTLALGDGTIATFDISGAYILDFDETMPIPMPDPWHDEPWEEIPEEYHNGPP